MESLISHRQQLAGFSLVEMAIVILIAGIMMGAGLSLLAVKQAAAQFDVTQKHQEIIKQALINYLGKNKRLPCPGDVTGAELTRSATLPTCQSYSGIVPYKELGLERTVALDGWENFIAYVVSPTPSTSLTPPFNAWLYTYGTPASTQVTIDPSWAFWPSNLSGSLNVTGTSTLNGMVVALISYGKNGYGAVNVKGGTNDSSAAGTDEKQNAANSVATTGVIKRDTSDSPAGNAFDDVVMILSANDLTGPLIANGTLQSSAQAALSQANDIVIGNIVATKMPYSYCPDACPPTPIAYSFNYTIPPSPPNPLSPTFPANVMAWGVIYSLGSAVTIDAINPAVSTQIAYTLTAGDGTTRTVLIGELRGILSRAAGF